MIIFSMSYSYQVLLLHCSYFFCIFIVACIMIAGEAVFHQRSIKAPFALDQVSGRQKPLVKLLTETAINTLGEMCC